MLIFESLHQHEQDSESKTRRIGGVVVAGIFAAWAQMMCWEPVFSLWFRVVVCDVFRLGLGTERLCCRFFECADVVGSASAYFWVRPVMGNIVSVRAWREGR